MEYEVENKFPIADLVPVVEQLRGLGAEFRDVVSQADVYFAHPVRDFKSTDEALRIRQVDESNVVTYKGPKIDKTTKTRREIELPLGSGVGRVAEYTSLLEALGFRTVATVRKQRRGGYLQWNEWTVELALDEVEGLGQFIELEIVVNQDQLAAAQTAVLDLAVHLGLPEPERRSYLGMILEIDDG